jgi:cell shape-determining protein MreC
MKTLQPKPKMKTMTETDQYIQKISEEFSNFQKTMEELRLLKNVAQDLKSYRRMLKVKRYD